jgi:type II restriction/modification system DNA methylase subunit YeeA
VGKLHRYIATVRVAKFRIFIWLEKTTLCSNKLIVIAREDDYFFGILHSRLHEVWSLANSSRHGDGSNGGRPTYTPSTCFETFPFPWPPGKEPAGDPRVLAIASAAKELVEMRDRWLSATPSGLRPPPPNPKNGDLGEAARGSEPKRTLTNLYNQRPTWLDLAHKKLDAAVLSAYGWPEGMSDDEILERLLKLNLERAGK